MHRLLLLAMLGSSLVQAQASIEVQPHALLRLPATTSELAMRRLHVADHGTLLIPGEMTAIRVEELRLGREARIVIAPSEQVFHLQVTGGEIAAGVQISARGAAGSARLPAMPGRTLDIRLGNIVAEAFVVDVRGGAGAPGYAGLHGGDGQDAGCLWGQASRGHDGFNGGDGQAGAAGGLVRVEVPMEFPPEHLQVRLEGGAGGRPGKAGGGGQGGSGKNCWLYAAEGARHGRPGQPGKAGTPGAAGSMNLLRF